MSVGAIVKAGKYVYDKLKQLEERNTRPFRETAAEEYLAEYSHALAARVDRLEDSDEVRAKVDDLVTDEFLFLQKNYEFEAIQEARKERRRMLAYAAAGSLSLSLSLSDVTRVERALRSLEPEDVRLLGRLVKQSELSLAELSPEGRKRYSARTRPHEPTLHKLYNVAQTEPKSMDALLTAGCMRLEPLAGMKSIPGVVLTGVGELTAGVLGDYLATISLAWQDK